MKTSTMIIAALTLSTAAASAMASPSQYGEPAAAADAHRTIVIKPDTQWVNVVDGETDRFVVGGREFAWTFDGSASLPFQLSSIAPAGLVPDDVKVYVGLNAEEKLDTDNDNN